VRSHLLPLVLSISLVVPFLSSCKGSIEDREKTNIKVVHWWGNARERWRSLLDDFERAHPGIEVEQEIVAYGPYVSKVLATAASGGVVGDVIVLEDWFAQELLTRDYCTNLQPMVERDLREEDFFWMSFDEYRHEGKLFAIPACVGVGVLFYNKTLFDRQGLPYPDTTWTYDDLVKAAKKLTLDTDGDGRIDQWGFIADDGMGFDTMLHSFGGAILDKEKKRSLLNHPKSVNAIRFWVDLVRRENISPASTLLLGASTVGGIINPFLTGKFAMTIQPDFKMPYQEAPFEWDITMPPIGPEGRKTLRFSQAFAIPVGSKHPQAAWQFIRWFINDAPLPGIDQILGGLTPVKRQRALSDSFLDGLPKCNRRVVVDLIDKYSHSYMRTGWQEFRDHGWVPQLDLALAGKQTPEDAASLGAKAVDEILTRHR
jgi:multiple sugar transport system substrate-binding protein